jgi:hypothetical protein
MGRSVFSGVAPVRKALHRQSKFTNTAQIVLRLQRLQDTLILFAMSMGVIVISRSLLEATLGRSAQVQIAAGNPHWLTQFRFAIKTSIAQGLLGIKAAPTNLGKVLRRTPPQLTNYGSRLPLLLPHRQQHSGHNLARTTASVTGV